MNYRKQLFLLIITLVPCICVIAQTSQNDVAAKQRAYLVNSISRIADPVLIALSKNQLKQLMPVESHPNSSDRNQYTYLEAFGRLMAGMAPWLALGNENNPEGKLRMKYIALAQACIHNATDPSSADFMNFKNGKQPLVDAAFLAQALLRAPEQLWLPLKSETKKNVINALQSSRVIEPYKSNWLLFSAMVEAALLKFDGKSDTAVIEYAIRQHFAWYKGDGAYGDGATFHWDYYNSFVIQPMMLETLQIMIELGYAKKAEYEIVLKRAIRYAAIQERFISPEGTYPAIGRSLAYRFGAFQLLSQIALMKALPQEVKPQQVRAALYTVIKKQIEAPGTFDSKGWLQIGFYGHQPGVGETYISTGSLYLCSQVFMILGLPSTDEFWKGPDLDWTSKKIWKGEKTPIDHAVD